MTGLLLALYTQRLCIISAAGILCLCMFTQNHAALPYSRASVYQFIQHSSAVEP